MTTLSPGDLAPDFTAPTDTDEFTLSQLRGRKVILFFYPQAMTPGCTKQACDFRDSLASLQRAGYDVVGISADAPEKLARFREKEGLTYPLVSDPEREILQAYGAWGLKKLYGREVEGAIRSTFVVDEEGVLTHALYNVKATGHVTRLHKLLDLD